jgi:hypothetical protein
MHFNALRSSLTSMTQSGLVVSSRDARWRRIAYATISLAAVAALTGSIACNDDAVAGPDSGVETVEVLPASLFLEVGSTASLQFVGRKADGTPVEGLTPKWEASDASKISISPSGLLTAMANGSAQATASLGRP